MPPEGLRAETHLPKPHLRIRCLPIKHGAMAQMHNPVDFADSSVLSPRGEMLVVHHTELDALAAAAAKSHRVVVWFRPPPVLPTL